MLALLRFFPVTLVQAPRKASEARDAAKRRREKEKERLASAAAAAERKAGKKAARKEGECGRGRRQRPCCQLPLLLLGVCLACRLAGAHCAARPDGCEVLVWGCWRCPCGCAETCGGAGVDTLCCAAHCLLLPCADPAAIAAAGSAASSRWASKLQQLQQQAAPAAAAAVADEAGSTSAEESASDDELEVYAFEHGSSSTGSQGPRQLREAQMPPLCSVRQLAGLLGVEVTRLEAVLQEQLGEEVKSGEWFVCVLRGQSLQGMSQH